MSTTNKVEPHNTLLASSARAAEIPESEDVYGWLVGSWDLDIHRYWGIDVKARAMKAEAHFGWALEGRAIQDVWIMPRIDERTPELDHTMNMYGSTLRIWDPAIRAWQIYWINPAGQHYERQIGRRVGSDVVQIGSRSNGMPTRWMFSEITPNSFHWTGEALDDDGRNWILEG